MWRAAHSDGMFVIGGVQLWVPIVSHSTQWSCSCTNRSQMESCGCWWNMTTLSCGFELLWALFGAYCTRALNINFTLVLDFGHRSQLSSFDGRCYFVVSCWWMCSFSLRFQVMQLYTRSGLSWRIQWDMAMSVLWSPGLNWIARGVFGEFGFIASTIFFIRSQKEPVMAWI